MFTISLGLSVVMALALVQLGSTLETLGFLFGVLLCLVGGSLIYDEWDHSSEREIVVGVSCWWIVALPIMITNGVTVGKIFSFLAISLLVQLSVRYRKRIP